MHLYCNIGPFILGQVSIAMEGKYIFFQNKAEIDSILGHNIRNLSENQLNPIFHNC